MLMEIRYLVFSFFQTQITICEKFYECKIVGMVTDNCAAITKARMLINNRIIEYGCGAHQLNLIAKGLGSANVVKRLVQIAKFFRINNVPRRLLKDAGCTKPPLPSDVRW